MPIRRYPTTRPRRDPSDAALSNRFPALDRPSPSACAEISSKNRYIIEESFGERERVVFDKLAVNEGFLANALHKRCALKLRQFVSFDEVVFVSHHTAER